MIVVRTAKAGDLDDVLALEQRSQQAPHWAPAIYAAMLVEDKTSALKRCLMVAVRNGAVIGFVAGSCLGGLAELESVLVEPEQRRRGVARMLCEAFSAWASARNADALDLEVRAGNSPARSLYVTLGYVDAGLRPGYYVDPLDDAVLMRLSLREAPRGKSL